MPTPSPTEITTTIHHALDQVERERDVRILFACESGSRGWGFESQDSDYDVRFIYVHRLEWKGNFREYLQSELVRTKKYLYVLRPVLACRWIEAGLGVVPMQFGTLYQAAAPKDAAVREAIEDLMAQKKAGFESDRGPRIDVLSAFLSAEIAHFEALQLRAPKRPPAAEMDRFFRGAVGRAWAG